MKGKVFRCTVLTVLIALIVGLMGTFGLAADVSGEGVTHDPTFHREFGVYYDEASGYLYVSDSLADRIIKTKMDGTGWVTLGTLGSGLGQFNDPRGIYYDSASGYVYVTDCGNCRIVRTKMDGSGWETFGTKGQGEGQFYFPRGTWYDPASELVYVPDTGNHRIVRTRMDGSGWETLGSEGLGEDQFLTPRGAQYDPASQLLYIADTGNNRIVRCAWDGSGWTTLGSWGKGDGQFRVPRQLHYDAATGLVYVADHSNHRIVSTKMDGSEWKTFGTFGGGEGQFFYPRGISLDPATGTVYVADTFNDRLVATQMDGSGWTTLGVKWRPYVWYFAEGSTRSEFDMFLTICNPGEQDAQVNTRYMMSDGSKIEDQVTVIAHSRYTVNVNHEVGDDKDLSVKVWSDQPVIVERPMYFHYAGRWPGGHVVMGKPTLGTDFYFAEGTTRAGFETYLCLQNPGETVANVDVTYMFPEGTTQEQDVTLPAHSRQTIHVNDVVGPDKDVSMLVESDVPILAERPMYFKYNGKITGGHVVIGATEPDTHFYLAEGTTRGGFTEFLCIMNPGAVPANVLIRYMFTDGQVQEQNLTVGGTSRQTVNVNDVVGAERDVAIEIISDQPVVVERPMYFVYKGFIYGGHNVIASSELGTEFFFAEGTTRPGFEEWVCLFNPGEDDAQVTLTYMFSDGSTKDQLVTVGARCRVTVSVNANVPEGVDVSLTVRSTQPIIVERPIYFNYNGNTTGGSTATGFNE